HVSGGVYMLVGAGANIVVQIGNEGVLVVDTGSANMTDKLLAAIHELSKKEIRWVVNTTLDPDHVGGNEKISAAGRTVNGNPAAIISHEKLPLRMVKLAVPVPLNARPLNTFFSEQRDLYFNDDPIFMYRSPGHTDGDIIVHFRSADVIAAGDTFLTTTYPSIDIANGGTTQGFIDGLNRILDLAVPKHLEEGGTYIVPGHGRICDEADVLEYHDMVVIVRDRIREAIKKGMTLEQVKAARLTRDFDARYAAATGPGSAATFIESVYRDLSGKK
ncbi:MAG TPA: MBL fold metallo-hydrolase, partial [Vicinamibacterales bacterium]|nr:MBL fold metallo-hydrolase [Vicinamibacterales bacterium]